MPDEIQPVLGNFQLMQGETDHWINLKNTENWNFDHS